MLIHKSKIISLWYEMKEIVRRMKASHSRI